MKLHNILKRDIEEKRSFWSTFRDPKGDHTEETSYSKTLASSVKGSYDVRHAYKKMQPANLLTEESVGAGQEFSLLTPKETKAYQGASNTMMTSTDTLAKVGSNPHLLAPRANNGSQLRVKTDSGVIRGKHDIEQVSIRFASPRGSHLLHSVYHEDPKSSKQQSTKPKSARSVVHFHSRYQPKLMTSAECRVELTQTGTNRKRTWRKSRPLSPTTTQVS